MQEKSERKKREAVLQNKVTQLIKRNNYLERLVENYKSSTSASAYTSSSKVNKQGSSNKFVLQMSLIPPYESEDISLPSSTKAIKDLHISSFDGCLSLFAPLGKKLSVLSMESNNIVLSYDLPQLEMLKHMRKFHLEDLSAILEKLHEQMLGADFEGNASVLSAEQIQEIVRRRVSPVYMSS